MAFDVCVCLVQVCILCHLLHTLHIMADNSISFTDDCPWSHTEQTNYNYISNDTAIQVVASECEQGSDGDLWNNWNKLPLELNIKVILEANFRRIYISWGYVRCYSVHYIQFEANFPPFNRYKDNRKCVRIEELRPIITASLMDEAILHFDCLRLPLHHVGTLTIRTTRLRGNGASCMPDRDVHVNRFNIGCPNHLVDVRFFGNCLGLEFFRLHEGIDYSKTVVRVNGEYMSNGLAIKRYNPHEGVLDLPVYKSGENYVRIKLVCNAYGEMRERTINLVKTIANLTACLKFTTENTNSPSLPVTDRSTEGRISLVIAVLSIVGMIVVTVTIIFCLKRFVSFIDCCKESTSNFGKEVTHGSSQNNTNTHEIIPLTGGPSFAVNDRR